jgi:hypothetical protein
MKPDKNTRTKVIVLVAILVAVWAVIGVRYFALSRYWKAKTAEQAAQQHDHPAGDEGHVASATAASTTSSEQPAAAAPSLRVAALAAPEPPKSDPFQPAISPRTTRRTTSMSAAPQPEARPLVPLPPPPSPSASADRDTLRVIGIIVGDASIPSNAVLRVGDQHYHVQEGDRLDGNIVVQTIDQSSVTLRDSRGTYTLRFGQ